MAPGDGFAPVSPGELAAAVHRRSPPLGGRGFVRPARFVGRVGGRRWARPCGRPTSLSQGQRPRPPAFLLSITERSLEYVPHARATGTCGAPKSRLLPAPPPPPPAGKTATTATGPTPGFVGLPREIRWPRFLDGAFRRQRPRSCKATGGRLAAPGVGAPPDANLYRRPAARRRPRRGRMPRVGRSCEGLVDFARRACCWPRACAPVWSGVALHGAVSCHGWAIADPPSARARSDHERRRCVPLLGVAAGRPLPRTRGRELRRACPLEEGAEDEHLPAAEHRVPRLGDGETTRRTPIAFFFSYTP